jgi:Tol biopolymer transport system component
MNRREMKKPRNRDGMMLDRRTGGEKLFPLGVTLAAALIALRAESAPEPASRADTNQAGMSGFGDSSAPQITPDGRFVAFASSAFNLVTQDTNGTLDVFLRDRLLGRTLLASLSADGNYSANRPSSLGAVSSNGQIVVFQSRANNIDPAASNGWENIFARDVVSGRSLLISVNTNGSGGDYSSANARITPDGRFVLFESLANDLVINDTNQWTDVFMRDLAGSNTVLVSVNATGSGSGAGYSINPSVTPDGRYVVFDSIAPDLVTHDFNNSSDVLVRDLIAHTTTLVSADANGMAAGGSRNAGISDDGRYVAFESTATNLVAGITDADALNDIFVRDMQTGVIRLGSVLGELNVPTNAPSRPVISHDGSLVVFQSGGGPPGATVSSGQLYAWYTNSDSNRLVSATLDGFSPASGVSHGPVISANNRFVTFLSNATNLVDGVTNGHFQVYQRDLAAGVTKLVSINPAGNGNNLDCSSVSAGDDGRIVAFDTIDGNLVSGDRNDAYDVFVRDLSVNSTELISQSISNLQSITPSGLSGIVPGAISADGRYVVFSTLADRLLPNDTNRAYDVLVRDLWNGTNALVSVGTNGAAGNGSSRGGMISADGRYIAFVSEATDLAPGVTLAANNAYLRDLQLWTTTLASSNTNGTAVLAGIANLSLSDDGRFTAYESTANNIVPSDSNNTSDVFVFDRVNGANILVSAANGLAQSGNGASVNPVISSDGTFVVFESRALNLTSNLITGSATRVYLRHLASGNTVLVSPVNANARLGAGRAIISADGRTVVFLVTTNIFAFDPSTGVSVRVADDGNNPSISADGRFVAFERFGPQSPVGWTNSAVMVADRQLQTEVLASPNLAGSGTGNGFSLGPIPGANGRYVVFKSKASDLVSNDNNEMSDVFVRDLVLGRTLLISASESGTTSGNLLSANPVMSRDGRTVVFESFASDLVMGDFNQARDIFVLRLGLGDSDGDGMDDDWEMTYFNNLDRDGAGDFDQDGMSDLAEFKAGTNPANDASILRAIQVTSLATGNATVYWNAVAGRTYQVQFKNRLQDSSWTNLPGAVTATGETASKSDTTIGSDVARFYRVVLVAP